MNLRHVLFGSFSYLAVLSSQGVTLEELAERLEQLEKKVEKYEAQYGPIDSSPSAGLVPHSNVIPLPTPVSRPVVTPAPAPADDIDSAFLTPSGGGAGNWFERTTLGGYGELHLNQGDVEQIDFHRFVLFINHSFSDRIKLFTELEIEHSVTGEGQPGAVELEQAYVEFLLDNDWSIRAGQYLVPVGILNEVHEPDTFYGVERNNVEVNIIPTTWWEGGVLATKNFDSGLGFDFGIHSALAVTTDLSSSNAFRIRSGRQQVAEADASDYAATFRARYNGIPGLSLTAFANYQNDIAPDNSEDNSAILLGGSAVYQRGGFGLRALIAHWEIQGQSFEDNDADSQWGAYIEPSYRWSFGDQAVGIFGRYSRYDFAQGAGNSRGGEFDEYSFGVNYWPIANVVLKADYTLIEQDGGEDNETYNFGVGYSF